jgi:hypothetical protein
MYFNLLNIITKKIKYSTFLRLDKIRKTCLPLHKQKNQPFLHFKT